MPDYDTLLADATQLPVGARMQLIDALWNTIPEDALPPLSDEWLAEIERRSGEYDAGLAQPISWEQIRADALNRLKTGQ
jgi:putative addiction module component (TIGR02574 family)